MSALSSMTGFARVSGDAEWGSWAWEAKSVNGRGLDIRLNTPGGFEEIETVLKSELGKRFKRGSLQIGLRIDFRGIESAPAINMALLQHLSDQARELSGESLNALAAAQLLSIKGVVETDSQSLRDVAVDPANVDLLLATGREAINGLAAAREQEGAWLQETLGQLISDMTRHAATARDLAGDHPQRLKTRLERQLTELGAEEAVDQDRLAAELALAAAKADVREELDRLDAHLVEAQKLVDAGSPVGRKLDFLAQELNREANTLCSKSISLDLTNAGLALKGLIDQFKEQAANVE